MARCAWLLMLMVGMTVGCNRASRTASGELSRVPVKEAQAANLDHSRFESAEDPPINPITRIAAGDLADAHDDHARAIVQYKEALKLDPNNTAALFRLGALYTRLKMFPEALSIWEHYVKATNQSASAYNNLALCHELAGNLQEAEATYQKGIERDPNNQECRVNYGLMLARNGRVPDAVEQFQAVLKPAEVHYNLGSVYEQQGKRDLARAEYEKALLLDANLRDARVRLMKLH